MRPAPAARYFLLGLAAALWMGRAASAAAAEPAGPAPLVAGTVVTESQAPHTETWNDMVRRDALQKQSLGPDAASETHIVPNPPPEGFFDRFPQVASESGATVSSPSPATLGLPEKSLAYNARHSVAIDFDGPTLTEMNSQISQWWIPPDTQGAAGPGHVMSLVNGAAKIQTRAGGDISLVSLTNFFRFTEVSSGLQYPRGNAFDPRLLYDPRSQRWYACALEFGETILVPGEDRPRNRDNHMVFAVSRSSDPTGTWDKYLVRVGLPDVQIPPIVLPFNLGTITFPLFTYFSDYQTMGVDDNGVYFAVKIFGNPSGQFARIFATRKAPLIDPSPSLGPVTAWGPIEDMYSTPFPLQNYDAVGSTDPMYFFSASPYEYAKTMYRRLVWSGATPSLSSVSRTAFAPAFAGPPLAPAQGSVVNINTGDMRLHSAIQQGGMMYMCRTVGVNSSGGASGADRAAVEWLGYRFIDFPILGEIPLLLDTGRIFDSASSNPRFYYFPSIAKNARGDIVMGFSGSRAGEYVGAYYADRLYTDPMGSMSAPTLYKAGEASYQNLDAPADKGGRNRWGDYSAACLDGLNGQNFWVLQEYADGPTSNRWATRYAKLGGLSPVLENINLILIAGGSYSILIHGQGFFDSSPDFPERLQFSLTGGLKSDLERVTIKYIDPTMFEVSFLVSPNIRPGKRGIRVANPDGESDELIDVVDVISTTDPTPTPSPTRTATPSPTPTGSPTESPTATPTPVEVSPCNLGRALSGFVGSRLASSRYFPDFPPSSCWFEDLDYRASWCFRVPDPGCRINLRVATTDGSDAPIALSVRKCCDDPNTEVRCVGGFTVNGVTLDALWLAPGFYTVLAETTGEFALTLAWGTDVCLIPTCYNPCGDAAFPTPTPSPTPSPVPVDPCFVRVPISGTTGPANLFMNEAASSFQPSTCAIDGLNHVAAACFTVKETTGVVFSGRQVLLPRQGEKPPGQGDAPESDVLVLSIRGQCDNVETEVACTGGSGTEGVFLQTALGPGSYSLIAEGAASTMLVLDWTSDVALDSSCDAGPPTPTPTPSPSPTPEGGLDSDHDSFTDDYERRFGSDPLNSHSLPLSLDLNQDGQVTVIDALLFYRNRVTTGLLLPAVQK